MAKSAGKTKFVIAWGSSRDDELRYATVLDPNLEQWRNLAAEWLATVPMAKDLAMTALKLFLVDYLHRQRLETDPAKFLRSGYRPPGFYESCLKHYETKKAIAKVFAKISEFIDYVLTHYFSVEDDHGYRIIPSEFRNPIPPLPATLDGHADENQESNKPVLPYPFIAKLRSVLCPDNAKSFADWKWAQTAEDTNSGGGWFVVPSTLIDETDPDCVFRTRKTSKYARKTYGYGDLVHEMWSPVRAVALYLKLQLPLRTHQVRMLDSGEADTQRYVQGTWVRSTGPLAKGTEKNPYHRGVFRQMTDNIKHVSMTGLFINTNKTADKDKDEWSKGYTIPWEHHDLLYWLERLRNWQEKYNPISAPMSWSDLELKHLGRPVSDVSLKAMGSNCFLFRDAATEGNDRYKPLGSAGIIEALWYKLLLELQNQCVTNKLLDLSGNPLVFVKADSIITTYYPLHALRVSLITAYALEGGVPMTILSKCIAGHARLIMTLYYTKVGITYCTETMDAATKLLMVNEQENYARWLKDKTYEQLEANGAFYDPAAIRAVMRAMQNGASLTKDDKGICPKGGWGCDSGGVYANDDTGRITYGEVPGYPQKNCPRCRWFFSGPPFVDGLNNHWNHIQLQLTDGGERIVKLEGQITLLEDQQYECQANDRPFLEQDKLNTFRKIYQAEYEKNDKLGQDSNATLRLITRCMTIAKKPQDGDGVQLVAVGGLQDVRIAINECDKLQLLLTTVAGSTVYPEHDVSKATLQVGKAFDMMLARNGKEPVFFRLDEEDLLPVVQHMTKLMAAEAGSIKDALPFIEGARRLAELGLDLDIEQLAKEMASGQVVQLASTTSHENAILGRYRLSPPTKECTKEISNDTE